MTKGEIEIKLAELEKAWETSWETHVIEDKDFEWLVAMARELYRHECPAIEQLLHCHCCAETPRKPDFCRKGRSREQ